MITPIPAAYNAYLVSFSQVSGNSTFVLTNPSHYIQESENVIFLANASANSSQVSGNLPSNLTNSDHSITMKILPPPGNSSTVGATFRLILTEALPPKFSTLKDAIGKSVMLEPFDLPGMVVVHQGINNNLAVAAPPAHGGSSIFRLVAGLDGRAETVSLESESKKDCFVHNGVNNNSSAIIKLSCKSGSSDVNFNQASSFIMEKGLTEYHPISFVAKAPKRNFLLAPLLSFRDEFYTVYFNIQA